MACGSATAIMPRMGLLKKIFGGDKAEPAQAPPSSQFHESETTTTEQGSRNAPRRELVQVVLRDTMRRHGVPSDWIDCRILSVVSRSAMTGMHVHLIVRQGHDRLLTYIPAFQSSFISAIQKFEPKVQEWLLSLSWQFEGISESNYPEMPDPRIWTVNGAAAIAAGPAGAQQDDEVMQDLKALFAIRDAALKDPAADHVDFEPTRPGFENSGGAKR